MVSPGSFPRKSSLLRMCKSPTDSAALTQGSVTQGSFLDHDAGAGPAEPGNPPSCLP